MVQYISRDGGGDDGGGTMPVGKQASARAVFFSLQVSRCFDFASTILGTLFQMVITQSPAHLFALMRTIHTPHTIPVILTAAQKPAESQPSPRGVCILLFLFGVGFAKKECSVVRCCWFCGGGRTPGAGAGAGPGRGGGN